MGTLHGYTDGHHKKELLGVTLGSDWDRFRIQRESRFRLRGCLARQTQTQRTSLL